jgi:hypothetical protein
VARQTANEKYGERNQPMGEPTDVKINPLQPSLANAFGPENPSVKSDIPALSYENPGRHEMSH